DAVHRTPNTGVGIAVGRGIGTETHQIESADLRARRNHSRAVRAIRKVESPGRSNRARRQDELRILAGGCTGSRAHHRIDVDTSLRRRWIDIAPDEQAMTLGAYVTHLQHKTVGDLSLDGQVVLNRVLRFEIRLELAVEQHRTKDGQINRLAGFRS